MTATLTIDERTITLTQVLKLAGLADSGGQAKMLISEGKVKVNGELELRKRRQMVKGDVVSMSETNSVKLV